ncbi:polysaccharide biosynthesis tyrosine autokinase [Haliea sp. E1-2-M8]|uniref:GumC family protein n=1 Tax=Haliea sp. E1-2-M8 TaxID=3064706 RepID=UPI002719AA8A|nr:polysaccharide biosynthesis tyrosine autokinase [Haliea sp. E1-2-M8]MDO8862431.1 polysaccharide biosynthesis tyrosine autokinase [Haliea sp. E1-2-M8]
MSSDTPRNEPVAPDHQLVIAEMRKQLARYEENLQNAAVERDDEVIDLRELWAMLVRRRWTVLVTALVIVVAGTVYTAMQTPIFRASTTVQIERESSNIVEFEDVVASESGSRDFYETQYELLQSRNLARRVIDQLGLQPPVAAETEAEAGPLDGFKAMLGGLFGAAPDTATSAEPEPAQAPNLEGRFLSNLTVEPVRNSRLVRLHYTSPDPREAALVVNTLAGAYVDMNLERRFEASTYAKSFLDERIKQVRADLEDSERVFLEYTQARGIVSTEDKLGTLTDKLRSLSSAQVTAESERISAESRYQEMLAADLDSMPQMLESQVIQELKKRKVALQTERSELARLFKPDYPAMVQLASKIEEVDAEIEREVANIRDSIRVEFQTRLRDEVKLQESIAATREEILQLEESSTDFTTLKREVDTNRELYDGLLQRMKEVGVAAGIANNNISVVDAAAVPRGPYSPNIKRSIALALVLGLFAGVGLAFLFELLDDTLKSSPELEKLLGKPVLGVIPKVPERELRGAGAALLAFHQPTSAFAEAYRSMRTALSFSTAEGVPRVLHVTSASAGEGKTTTAVSAAINLCQTGANVLLIDADLRNPSLHKAFDVPNHKGLSNYLSGAADPAEVTQPTGVKGLFLMSSGPIPPNPAELLHGARMIDLASLGAKRFDYVIIDSPPLLGLADALILGDVAQATLLVVQANSTRQGAVEAALKRLRHSRANVLGAVMTKFDMSKSSYGYGYDYQYSYSYGATPEQVAAANDEAAAPRRA